MKTSWTETESTRPDKIAPVESDTRTASDVFRGIVTSAQSSTTNASHSFEFTEANRSISFVPREGRLVVIAPRGLWVENAKLFQHAILGKITDSVRAVDLKLSEIARFDTWALCTLLSLRRYFSARLIRFRLVEPSPRVEMILEMTKTRSLFEVVVATPAPAGSGEGPVTQVDREGRQY